jgi:hypothetical protein
MNFNDSVSIDGPDYSIYKIRVNPRPTSVEETPDGETKQAWEIQLKEPMVSQVNLEEISQLLSRENYNVSLTAKDQLTIVANVSFFKDPNPYGHDRSAIAHFKMFNDIENLICRIEAVQGKDYQDWWIP